MKKICLIFILSLSFSTLQAQSVYDFAKWLNQTGYEDLGFLAHPNNKGIKDFEILSYTNESLLVSVYFKGGLISDYRCKYELVFESYQKILFVKNIRVLQEGAIASSFFASSLLENIFAQNRAAYSELQVSGADLRSIYGSSYYDDLSNSKKAAFALTGSFLSYYY